MKNSDVGNCTKVIFKTRLILIDSRAGQLEDCTNPRGLKQWTTILLIRGFILLVLILDGFFRSMSQIKTYNFLKPRKTVMQHFNLFLPSNRPKHGRYIFKTNWKHRRKWLYKILLYHKTNNFLYTKSLTVSATGCMYWSAVYGKKQKFVFILTPQFVQGTYVLYCTYFNK